MARSFGSENSRRTALDDGRRNCRTVDVGERLGCENDRGIFLAKRLQPLPQLTSKFPVIKREPPFIDDEQGWPAVEPSLNAMEQIRKDGWRNRRPNQPICLKDLNGAFAQTLELCIKKSAVWPTEAVGLERALKHIRLKKRTKTRQGSFRNWRGGQGGQCRPEMLPCFRRDFDSLAAEDRADPVCRPSTLG